jgi:beta-lactamase class A
LGDAAHIPTAAGFRGPVAAMAATPDGLGYWLATSNGEIYSFGSAHYYGGAGAAAAEGPFDGMAAGAQGLGYWLARGERTTADVFSSPLQVALNARAGRISAAVLDLRTGCLYQFHPGWQSVTASVIKVAILATLLAQVNEGRPFTSAEQAQAAPMIEISDNDDASALWQDAGGAPAIAAFGAEVGMTATTPNVAWGLTTTTAADQIVLLRYLVYPNTVLSSTARAYELNLMEHVAPYEAWGVTAGTPPDAVVALKNGWLPLSTGWEVNSVGWARGAGRDYLIAVLTSGSPTEVYGIASVSMVAAAAWKALGPTA